MRHPLSISHNWLRARFAQRDFRYRGIIQVTLKPFLWLTSLCILVVASLSGCSPLYVLRAAYEEGKILWRREPIVDFLNNPQVKPDTQEKLQLVLAVREYARDVLKFNVGGSYSS